MSVIQDYLDLYRDLETAAQHLGEDKRIQISSEWADRNPNMADDEWARSALHYKVTLRRRTATGKKRTMTLFFSLGSAHKSEPKLQDVLDSLLSDSGTPDFSFEEWCAEYGYDTDSRRAEKTYKACLKQTERFQAFLED